MEWYKMDAGKCLEFSKKMAVLRKLVRLGLISENEYIRAKNRIMSSYHILDVYRAGCAEVQHSVRRHRRFPDRAQRAGRCADAL